MPAVRFSPPESLNSLDMSCEYCGTSPIDLWKATTCEHYICKNCLLDDQASREPQCPRCNGECLLLCPGSRFGCKYQTSIARDGVLHLRTCLRRPTPCPNDCSSIVANTDLPKHMTEVCARRTQECRFCYGNYFVSEIGAHFKGCVKYPVTCQYCSQENIRRGSLEQHAAGCRKTPKACKLSALGCTFKAGDDEMERHMTLEKHAVCIHEMKMQVSILESEARQLREQISRENEERQKVEKMLRKEQQVREDEVKKLRNDVDMLVRHIGGRCDNA